MPTRQAPAFLLVTLALAVLCSVVAYEHYLPLPEEALLGDFEGTVVQAEDYAARRRLSEKTCSPDPLSKANSTTAMSEQTQIPCQKISATRAALAPQANSTAPMARDTNLKALSQPTPKPPPSSSSRPLKHPPAAEPPKSPGKQLIRPPAPSPPRKHRQPLTPVLVGKKMSAQGPDAPVICGTSNSSFTISFGGPRNNTLCTASASLSDDGSVPCKEYGKAYGEECDTYLGAMNINVGLTDPSRTHEPDVQGGLATLGFGNLSEIGLLHITVGGTAQGALSAINFLPSLQAIIGAINPNPSNGFTGAALYISGSTSGSSSVLDIASLPSLSRLKDINGTTIIQGTALANLTSGLAALKAVEGDFVVQNNNNLISLRGTLQSLQTVKGQVYIANNPVLTSLAGINATAGALKTVGGQLVIGGNPMLQSLAGLENLESVGGPITISQNSLLTNVTALSKYAKCATKPTSQITPVPIFIQVVVQLQLGAPPITCILNTFPAICSYIATTGCPNPDGTPADIGGSGMGNGD